MSSGRHRSTSLSEEAATQNEYPGQERAVTVPVGANSFGKRRQEEKMAVDRRATAWFRLAWNERLGEHSLQSAFVIYG